MAQATGDAGALEGAVRADRAGAGEDELVEAPAADVGDRRGDRLLPAVLGGDRRGLIARRGRIVLRRCTALQPGQIARQLPAQKTSSSLCASTTTLSDRLAVFSRLVTRMRGTVMRPAGNGLQAPFAARSGAKEKPPTKSGPGAAGSATASLASEAQASATSRKRSAPAALIAHAVPMPAIASRSAGRSQSTVSTPAARARCSGARMSSGGATATVRATRTGRRRARARSMPRAICRRIPPGSGSICRCMTPSGRRR